MSDTHAFSGSELCDRSTRHQGILVFLIVTLGLAWTLVLLLRGVLPPEPQSLATRMLQASMLYSFTMAIPPLVAIRIVRRWVDRAPIDYGARRPPGRYHLLAVFAPLAVIVLASGIAELAAAGQEPAPGGASAGSPGWMLPVWLVGACLSLWIQCASEELGWRGYLMHRMMRLLGAWPGLVLHAVLWGLWYAPHFLLAAGSSDPLQRSGRFVVTCTLLGVLLGWLRIASRSSLASTTANYVLTLGAALPLTLYGTSIARTTAYESLGWIPLSLAVLLLFLTGRHRAVRGFSSNARNTASQ